MHRFSVRYFLIFFLAAAFPAAASAADRVSFITDKGESAQVYPDEIIVKFRPELAAASKSAAHGKLNARKARTVNRLGAELVSLEKGSDIRSALEYYRNLDGVEYAEPVYVWRILELPDEYDDEEELEERQWGLYTADAPGAWDVETGNGVVIAILDTGIDMSHPDLNSNIWDNPLSDKKYRIDDTTYTIKYDTHGWDFVDDDNDPADEHGHGTHCAGIAGAETNKSTFGIAGVSWKNDLMAVRVLDADGYGGTDDIASGIIYAADRGADIISMSLGGTGDSELVEEAVGYAYEKGCVLIAAAGNEGSSELTYPAGFDKVMSVAASDKDDEKADFSNYGKGLDVMAPGVDIYSTVPTYSAGGDFDKNYDSLDGTSMACPHVAGLASLVIAYWERGTNKDWQPSEVKNVITSNCDDVNIDAYPGWDRFTGYGRINMRKTMAAIQEGTVNVSEDKVLIYPNPFNPDTQEALIVPPQDYDGVARKLRIYSLDGQLVRQTGVSGSVAVWDGKNDKGDKCASGLYFFYLDTTTGSEKGKITLIR
ncbi:MAG: S8 family serine peptidase [Elusimicrobia bacterium]|nr:S8 family serine peptidase [Elusimicrobiota bacterium]